MDYLTQTFNTTGEVVSGAFNTTGEVVSGAFNTTGEVVGSAFNWVVEHPVETIVLTIATVGTILAFSTGVGEAATAVAALFVGITALFNN